MIAFLARSNVVLAAGALALVAFSASPAHAHFVLEAPEASLQQNATGDPQKTGPCGGTGTATNAVTTFAPGEEITIEINETIYHPGHYRVALSTTTPQALPATPQVTPEAGDQCGSAAIQDPAMFPVLVDGALKHTSAFTGPQTFKVKLPTDVTCDSCTLQVLEFMADHAAPCFYYHCANIAIKGTATGAGGASGSGGAASGAGGAAPSGGTGGSGGTGIAGGRGGAGGAAGLGGASAGSAGAPTPAQGGSGGSTSAQAGTAALPVGGSIAGSAGSGSALAGSAGAPGTPQPPADSEEESGGCGLARTSHGSVFALGALLPLALGVALRRLRRRTASR